VGASAPSQSANLLTCLFNFILTASQILSNQAKTMTGQEGLPAPALFKTQEKFQKLL
jgi:hypothetical protein